MKLQILLTILPLCVVGVISANTALSDLVYDPSKSYSTGDAVIPTDSDFTLYTAKTTVPKGNFRPPNSTYWLTAEEKSTELANTYSDTVSTPPSSDSIDTSEISNLGTPESGDAGGGEGTSVVDLINISTNGYALTGAEKMSAGFIISGSEAMTVYIKAEKSQEAGITPLSDPKLEIWNIQRTQKLAENDNWGDSANLAAINALGGNYPPIEATDSAVIMTLNPGPYLADVYGAKGNSGKVLVAVNDVDTSSSSKLINISTNGYAYTGSEKMSAGFIISGTGSKTVYIKAEKSQEAGITPLSDPKLEIWNITRTEKLAENDNWGDSENLSAINALGGNYPPIEATDSAVIITLPPGPYLADVYGAKGNSGKVLVAVNLVE